jgi:hypothetical protein
MCVCVYVRACACMYVRMEYLHSHWTDFHEIRYLNIFRKSVEKKTSFIEIWQEYRVLYMKPDINFLSYRTFIPRIRNVSDKSCSDYKTTDFVFSNFFFLLFSKILP